jgi:hypothetical protein
VVLIHPSPSPYLLPKISSAQQFSGLSHPLHPLPTLEAVP